MIKSVLHEYVQPVSCTARIHFIQEGIFVADQDQRLILFKVTLRRKQPEKHMVSSQVPIKMQLCKMTPFSVTLGVTVYCMDKSAFANCLIVCIR